MNQQLKLVLCLALFVSTGFLAAVADADLITPTSINPSSQFTPATATIDGSGLDGIGPVLDQTHGTDELDMWFSDGFSTVVEDQFLEFTLDQTYDLSAAHIWQFNGINANTGGDDSFRGMNDFSLSVSPDLVSPFVPIGGARNLAQADPLFSPDESAQVFDMTGANGIRRVRIDIDSAHGSTDFVGLSEVRFDGTPLPFGPDRTWIGDLPGVWQNDGFWDPASAPNGSDQNAIFGNAITAARTVVTDDSVTVKAITFANTNSYIIAGAGDVTLEADSGDSAITVSGGMDAGSHQFQAVVNLANTTNVDIGSGAELVFNNALNLHGNNINKTGAGTLTINNQLNTGGGMINAASGIVGGSGTVGGDLNNMGATVAPGNSAGVLTVNGSYTQATAGTLSIEIGGADPGSGHDQLSVAQAASLDGALDVDTLAGYADPTNRGDHDVLVLLIANSVDGTFSSVDYDGTPLAVGANYVGTNQNGDDGLFRNLGYSDTDVTVTNYLALGGDANGDLVVDGLDFIVWNAHKFTSGNDWATGDFTGDGVVDGLDFIVWNENKFTSADGINAVPEPSFSLMTLACLIGMGWRHRR
jgi:hypothetical protein